MMAEIAISENWLIAILSTMAGVIGAMFVAGVIFAISVSSRLSCIETLLIMRIKGSADALHSPHTPEMDKLLEKVCSDQKIERSEAEMLISMLKEQEIIAYNEGKKDRLWDIRYLITALEKFWRKL